MVEVDVCDGEPILEEDFGEHLRLRHVHEWQVPVVVVADIFVVQPRHGAALVLGPEVLVVPVNDHDVAVGVRTGDQ